MVARQPPVRLLHAGPVQQVVFPWACRAQSPLSMRCQRPYVVLLVIIVMEYSCED